jgi:hypothetical protein
MMPHITPSASWTERYETLRRYIMNDNHVFESSPLGLALWLAQGMAGWMRGWTQAVQVASSPALVRLPVRITATPLWQQQLTMLLAQITVQRLFPASGL